MPQSLSAVYIHFVFSTKDRRPFLSDPKIRAEMHSYLAGVSYHMQCPALIIGGVEDHVHGLVRLHRTISQADWVKETKRVTSLWVKPKAGEMQDFGWQSGFGAFSVDATNLDGLRRYIENQEEHHRHVTFKEEFIALLEVHGLEWDERYVWD